MSKTSSPKGYPLWRSPGVLTVSGPEDSGAGPILIAAVTTDRKRSMSITTTQGDVETYTTSNITNDPRTDRIEFVSKDTTYRVRELRESDGSWLSAFKADLPVEALRVFATQEENMKPEETLDAFALGDSVYVVGLVYTNSLGRWSRIDGDWILLSPGDSTFEGMEVLTIDPQRGKSYIELYDKNFVTTADTEKYESANPQEQSAPAEANPTS